MFEVNEQSCTCAVNAEASLFAFSFALLLLVFSLLLLLFGMLLLLGVSKKFHARCARDEGDELSCGCVCEGRSDCGGGRGGGEERECVSSVFTSGMEMRGGGAENEEENEDEAEEEEDEEDEDEEEDNETGENEIEAEEESVDDAEEDDMCVLSGFRDAMDTPPAPAIWP